MSSAFLVASNKGDGQLRGAAARGLKPSLDGRFNGAEVRVVDRQTVSWYHEDPARAAAAIHGLDLNVGFVRNFDVTVAQAFNTPW
jgi:hypothetical protein